MSDVFILCRFAHFAATMALFGLSLFLAAFAPPDLGAAMGRPLRRLEVAALCLAAMTLVLWLLIEAGEMGDGWADVFDVDVVTAVLLDTSFGHIWLARLVIATALVGSTIWPSRSHIRETALASLFLASLGLVGHASMRDDAMGLLERGNQALHLLAGGFWIGMLIPLLVCLPYLRKASLKHDAGAALRRFSGFGHLAVAAVALTGSVNTMIILKRPPMDMGSPYQAMLAAKICFVAVMILLALYNRYICVPRLAGSVDVLTKLIRNTWLELALGACVLALVSALATMNPN